MAIKDTHYVIEFSHIDDYRCLRPLIESVIDHDNPDLDYAACKAKENELRSELEALFSEAGWEGDGEIDCIFMPPCFIGQDGFCVPVYHVKQGNNGTSWLAIPNDLKLSLPDNVPAAIGGPGIWN